MTSTERRDWMSSRVDDTKAGTFTDMTLVNAPGDVLSQRRSDKFWQCVIASHLFVCVLCRYL